MASLASALASQHRDGSGTEPLASLQLQALTQWGAWVTPHAAGYHEGLAQVLGQEIVDSLSCWRRGMGLPHPVSLPY